MIEGLTSVITPKPQPQASEGESDGTMESVALAGAAAIPQLFGGVRERDDAPAHVDESHVMGKGSAPVQVESEAGQSEAKRHQKPGDFAHRSAVKAKDS